MAVEVGRERLRIWVTRVPGQDTLYVDLEHVWFWDPFNESGGPVPRLAADQKSGIDVRSGGDAR